MGKTECGQKEAVLSGTCFFCFRITSPNFSIESDEGGFCGFSEDRRRNEKFE